MRIAFVPSNQDTNTPYPNGEQEMAVMHRLAAKCAERARAIEGVEAMCISGTPQSQDKTELQGLYRQFDNAVTYLAGQPGLIASLHSDGGGSHVGYAHGNAKAKALGLAIANALEGLMHTGRIIPFSYAGWVFDRCSGGYTSVLMECGSHQSEHDVAYLLNHQGEMAGAIVDAALAYVGVPILEKRDEAAAYFEMHGVPYVPEFAIPRYWRMLRERGVNPGPAITQEMGGELIGEPGHTVQFFESLAIVCHPEEDYACYLYQTYLHRPPVAA
jgi:hypothetical protein